MTTKELMNMAEVLGALGVTYPTLRKYMDKGIIGRGLRQGRRRYWRPEDVEAAAARLQEEVPIVEEEFVAVGADG